MDGKLLTVNEKGDLVTEAGSGTTIASARAEPADIVRRVSLYNGRGNLKTKALNPNCGTTSGGIYFKKSSICKV